MKRTARTPSRNADWPELFNESSDESTSGAAASPTLPQHMINNTSSSRNTFHSTSLAFSYDDDEDYIVPTSGSGRILSQPNLMKTNFTNQTRGQLTRHPSTGSLVSIEVLQELMMDKSTKSDINRSAKSIASYDSGCKSNVSSFNCSHRSFGSEGDAVRTEEGGWKARVSQLKQFALIDGLFGGEKEPLKWSPFGSINAGRKEDDFVMETRKPSHDLSLRPKRRSLPESLCSGSDIDLPLDNSSSSKEDLLRLKLPIHRDDALNLSANQRQFCIETTEDRRGRRASDPPTSPTLSIRTAHSDGEMLSELPTNMGNATAGKDSSNDVCDVDKSPLVSSDDLQPSQKLSSIVVHQTDANETDDLIRDMQSSTVHSNGAKENQRDSVALTESAFRSLVFGEKEADLQSNAQASADLNDLLLSLYDQHNTQHVKDDKEETEPSDIKLSVHSVFEKASMRKSFQKSLNESFQSGDFDYQLSDVMSSASKSAEDDKPESQQKQRGQQNAAAVKKEVSQTGNRGESYQSYRQRNSARIRRRPTVESETGKSVVSSLDSLASPIDRARVCHVAAAAVTAHATRKYLSQSQFTNMAHAEMSPLRHDSSFGSMSSLGNESIDRGGIRTEEFLTKRSDEHSATLRKSQESNPERSGNKDVGETEPVERNGWVSGDKSSITMGSFFTELQKTLTENTSTSGRLDTSERRRSGASSLTLGTFLNELQKLDEDCPKNEDDSKEGNANVMDDMCDFDSGLASFVFAMRLGHYDCHDDVIGNINTDEDDDRYLAAKAFMGLGFAGQLKGENEIALDWYMKSLQLWESELGAEHASLACLHYTIGMALSQERNELEASVHFNNALSLLKSNENIDETFRASILATEGMIFNVLGDAQRSIDCLKKALLLHRNFDLNYATIMYEMGTLLAKQGELEHAINCYRHTLAIRERIIGNSFLTMQTHYSLGITLAEVDSSMSRDYSLIHLQQALALCGHDHIQAPTIIHAIGVLNEKKGDYHSAANWFYKELSAIKSLFGDGK